MLLLFTFVHFHKQTDGVHYLSVFLHLTVILYDIQIWWEHFFIKCRCFYISDYWSNVKWSGKYYYLRGCHNYKYCVSLTTVRHQKLALNRTNNVWLSLILRCESTNFHQTQRWECHLYSLVGFWWFISKSVSYVYKIFQLKYARDMHLVSFEISIIDLSLKL